MDVILQGIPHTTCTSDKLITRTNDQKYTLPISKNAEMPTVSVPMSHTEVRQMQV